MVISDPWDTLCRLTYDNLYYAPCLDCWALFGSLVSALCNRTSRAQVYELPQSHCGDNREGTSFSWLFSHIYIYINYFPSVLIYVLPFINHIKITLKAQSLPLGKRNGGMYYWNLVVYTFHIKFYFSGKRQRKTTKNPSKICHWKLILVIWNYSTWPLRHARHVGMWARKARNLANSNFSRSWSWAENKESENLSF